MRGALDSSFLPRTCLILLAFHRNNLPQQQCNTLQQKGTKRASRYARDDARRASNAKSNIRSPVEHVVECIGTRRRYIVGETNTVSKQHLGDYAYRCNACKWWGHFPRFCT